MPDALPLVNAALACFTAPRMLRPFLVALALGFGSAVAFQPLGWWPVMILAVSILCALIVRQATLGRALLVGWGFGVGQFTLGLNWIATAFTFQANMPAWLGWIAVVLLSLYLAVYPMIAAGLAWRFGRDRPLALVLALAGGWALTEWLRATMFTGFAWNPLGVVLVDTPWRATSAFVGTYGLSAMVVAAGGFVWMAARREWKAPAGFVAVMLLALALPKPVIEQDGLLRTFDVAESRANGARVGDSEVRFTPIGRPKAAERATPPAPPAPPPPVPTDRSAPPPVITATSAIDTGVWRIVQPNIGQADKWRDGFERIAADKLAGLTAQPIAPEGPAGTVFWPEAAVTEPLVDERRAAESFVAYERLRATRALMPGQLLATGGLALTSSDGVRVDGATNSVFVLNKAGRIVGRYDKSHLVPYGEYLPMRPVLSAIGLSRLAPGDLDFRPGPGPRTLALPNGAKMGVQICYEIIFSGEVVDRGTRPDYVFNPSNDAWFGAWGPPQHLAQAQLRAAEEGVPIIRATPTGISAMIDVGGGLQETVGGGQAGVIDTFAMRATPPTPFARLGNAIPLLLGAILLVAGVALGRRRR